MDDPIIRYLPALKGTAWNEVTLRVLLQHGSGVAWNEHYADPDSDFAKLTRCEAGPDPYACVMQLVSSRPRKPGRCADRGGQSAPHSRRKRRTINCVDSY